MTPAPGTGLGPYRIEASIGAGGMGAVYKARDTLLARIVAVKIVGRRSTRSIRSSLPIGAGGTGEVYRAQDRKASSSAPSSR